jgi:hypothetical protein
MISNETIEGIAMRTAQAHSDSYGSLKEKWNSLYERYENKPRIGSISMKTESKVSLGAAFSLVENAIPRLLGRDPKYKYMGREGDDEEVSDEYERFSEWQFDKSGARRQLRYIVKWGLICGLSGWKMGWETKRKIVSKDGREVMGIRYSNPMLIKALDTMKVGKKVKVDSEVSESNYTIMAIKPHDLVWSPSATEMEDTKVFGHSSVDTISGLKAKGFDTKTTETMIRGTDEWMNILKQSDGVHDDKQIDLDAMMDSMEVSVYELYVDSVNEQGVTESYVCWVTGKSGGFAPLKTIQNPFDKKFIPMGFYRPIDRPGKFYGFGIIEPTIGVLDAEEDSLNIALETWWTSTVPPIEYDPTNVVDIESLEYGPRKLTAVRKLGATMNVMPTQQVATGAVQVFLEFLNRAKQNTSGITDFQTGSDQIGGAKTLGEIQIKTQESNSRINEMLTNLEQQVLEPMGRMALWFNQQYLFGENGDKKMFFRILGKKGETVAKSIRYKDIEAIDDVVIVSGASALASQQAEIGKWSAVLNQVYLEEASPNPTKINKLPIWKQIFETGLLVKDSENYLPSLKAIEEEEVGGNVAQLEDAKKENANPLIARVIETDNPDIHIPVHQAEIAKRKNELDMAAQAGVQVPDEVVMELQMLVAHLDSHLIQSGSPVPEHSANMQVGQGTESAAQPTR